MFWASIEEQAQDTDQVDIGEGENECRNAFNCEKKKQAELG